MQEKDMIEVALKDTCARVSGPTGAAASWDTTVYAEIEDSVVKDQQESLHDFVGNLRLELAARITVSR